MPRVQESLETHKGTYGIADFIPTEARSAMGIPPIDTRRAEGGWIVAFPRAVSPFRLFGSALARPVKPKVTTRQCSNCFAFQHLARECRGKQRCPKCGGLTALHADGVCLPAKCPNCWGPFSPDHSSCPVRPVHTAGRVVKPSPEQVRAFRTMEAKACTELAKRGRDRAPKPLARTRTTSCSRNPCRT